MLFVSQVMLILVDVQYLRNVVFCFEKGLNGQKHSSSDFKHPVEKSPPAKFLIPPNWGNFPPVINAIWKTLLLINISTYINLQFINLVRTRIANMMQTSRLHKFLSPWRHASLARFFRGWGRVKLFNPGAIRKWGWWWKRSFYGIPHILHMTAHTPLVWCTISVCNIFFFFF